MLKANYNWKERKKINIYHAWNDLKYFVQYIQSPFNTRSFCSHCHLHSKNITINNSIVA